MADIESTCLIVSGGKGRVYTWTLADGDVGDPVEAVDFADRSVQMAGAFGGATIAFEGSNDGEAYEVLTDPQGNNLNFVGAKIEMVTEVTRFVRPRVVGGTGVGVTVSLLTRFTS
jgi:hypothetical protein